MNNCRNCNCVNNDTQNRILINTIEIQNDIIHKYELMIKQLNHKIYDLESRLNLLEEEKVQYNLVYEELHRDFIRMSNNYDKQEW
jgi:hypothetical protein